MTARFYTFIAGGCAYVIDSLYCHKVVRSFGRKSVDGRRGRLTKQQVEAAADQRVAQLNQDNDSARNGSVEAAGGAGRSAEPHPQRSVPRQ